MLLCVLHIWRNFERINRLGVTTTAIRLRKICVSGCAMENSAANIEENKLEGADVARNYLSQYNFCKFTELHHGFVIVT